MRHSTPLAATLLGTLLCGVSAFAQAPAAAPPPIKADKNGIGPKSKAEETAVRAMFESQSKSPDDQIAACENLLNKFADSVYKSFALELEAEAWQKKNDNTKAIVYGEQALAADPKNYDADNLLAKIYASTTKDTDLNKEESLTKADKYAQDALAALDAGKPAIFSKASDDLWNKTKAGASEQAYQALGMAAQDRRKYDEAAADFQKGLDQLPDPLLMIRMGRLLSLQKKYDDAIGWDQKVVDSATAPDQYKSIAKSDMQRFQLSKQQASK